MGLGTKVASLYVDIKERGAKKAAKDLTHLEIAAKKFGVSTRRMGAAMDETGRKFNKTGAIIRNKYGTQLDKLNKQHKTLIKSTKRFRGELLSFMFIGMAVAGMFRAYVTGGADILGINDILRDSLSMAVASFMELLGIDEVTEKFNEFVESNQNLVGFLIMIGFVAGIAAMGIGMLGIVDVGLIVMQLKNMYKWLKAITLLKVLKFFGWVWVVIQAFQGLKLLLGENNEKWEKMKGVILIIGAAALAIFLIFGGWIWAAIWIASLIIAWASKFDVVKDALSWIWDKLVSILGAMKDFAKGAWGKIGGFFGFEGMAEGGIVTRPTAALIGEAGPEAVIPLNKLSSFSPNVTVNANLSSGIDVTLLANRLAKVYANELHSQGLTRRIG